MPIALVTGASRGVGKGVALALGSAGWTVWVTGRSTRAEGGTSHLGGTIDDTADEIRRRGGEGVPFACDHRSESSISALVDALAATTRQLDLLVNNSWGGYERLNAGAWDEWNAPFFEQPVEMFDAMMSTGVRSHYLTTAGCAPLLMASPSALVVTISFANIHPVAYAVGQPPPGPRPDRRDHAVRRAPRSR